MSVLETYAIIAASANINCRSGPDQLICSRTGGITWVPTPKPTRVAMDELQLQLLQKAEAADPPMNNMKPEKRLDPMVAMPPPRRGKDRRAPIVEV
jgi:hypothetical protein